MVDNRFLILIFLVAAQLFAAGCARMENYAFLPREMRREIYLDVTNIIEEHLEAGNDYYENGDYYDALKNYRIAVFYDDSLAEIKERVKGLEKRIATDSEKSYQQGLALLDTDRAGALKAFNRAVHINPEHEKARKEYNALLREPEFQEKLARLEEALDENFKNYNKTEEEIATLSKQVAEILALDHKNKKALAARPVLEADKRRFIYRYIEKGEQLLEAGKLDEAKESFKKAQQLAEKDNGEIREYLREIQRQKDIQYALNLAKYRLRKKDYQKAVEFAGKVLSMDARNNEAKQILSNALLGQQKATLDRAKHYFEQRDYANALSSLNHLLADNANGNGEETVKLMNIVKEKLDKEIEQMLSEGQALYDKKEFTESLTLFEFVLQVDPENDIAKTFIKKIHSRLETIESLK